MNRRLTIEASVGLLVDTVAIPPGAEHTYAEADWRDALVLIDQGELDLECTDGGVWRFTRGAVLCLANLPLRTLRNEGREPLTLTRVRRS